MNVMQAEACMSSRCEGRRWEEVAVVGSPSSAGPRRWPSEGWPEKAGRPGAGPRRLAVEEVTLNHRGGVRCPLLRANAPSPPADVPPEHRHGLGPIRKVATRSRSIAVGKVHSSTPNAR